MNRTRTVAKPNDWDAAVSAAYLRCLGASQKDAAAVAGVGKRTLTRWEASDFWPEAMAEAGDRWLKGITAKTRVALERLVNAVEPDPATVRFLAERLLPELAAPVERIELTGSDGGPVEVRPAREILRERVEAIREAKAIEDAS